MFSPSDRLRLFSGKTRYILSFTPFVMQKVNQERQNIQAHTNSFIRNRLVHSITNLLRILQHLRAENDIVLQPCTPINSDVEELEQEVCRLQQQLQMAEEELSRRYEPDPVRFTSMEDYEVCEKQLLDTLTHVVQRTIYLHMKHLLCFTTGRELSSPM
uniref:Uncharacterized protein n=1 Tax=Brassica oleracea TaxID=3712 RepID=A0A3P6EU16_BRAOL|nr:unnamed protein product [Brassica oleracea]